MRKGDKLEKDFSKAIHQTNCPVLISSLLLRSINAGQIDIACLKKKKNEWMLFLYEIKFSMEPGYCQRMRLLRAQDYLSRVLAMPAKLEVKFCKNGDP